MESNLKIFVLAGTESVSLKVDEMESKLKIFVLAGTEGLSWKVDEMERWKVS